MQTIAILNDKFFVQKPFWMPQKLHNVVCQRANPRNKKYLMDLLSVKYPDAKLVGCDQLYADNKIDIKNQNIILIYADSIGLGNTALEAYLRAKKTKITVLNGRKREFELTPFLRLQLVFKRLLEVTFLPELLFAPLLLIVGSFLALKDFIFGFENE